jgi:hypothetical protein
MTDPDITHITGKALTVEDANDVLRQVQEALHRLHGTTAAPADILTETLSQSLWERLQDVVSQQPASEGDVTTLRELLHAVQLHLMGLDVMTITIAFHPRHEFIASLTEWLETAAPRPLKLAVNINPALVASARVEWEGRMIDYSLEDKLDQLIAKEFGPEPDTA